MSFSSIVLADAALIARDDVKAYIHSITHNTGLNHTEVTNLLLAAEYKPAIINALERPSTKLPWYRFSANMLSAKRISQGVQFWRDNQEVLTQASKKYGIAPEIIVAILGIETQYGRNSGHFRAIDALSTAAFHYPRRAEYFQEELRNFFILAKKLGKDPLHFKSSYAGAMGMPQFMPKSFLKYAVNHAGDTIPDIWEKNSDAIASIANYLHAFGWQKDAPIVIPTSQADTLSADKLTHISDSFNLNNTVADWEKQGIIAKIKIASHDKAVLFKLDQPSHSEYWLGLKNFYVITRYNKSTMYAMAVVQLGDLIKAAYKSKV